MNQSSGTRAIPWEPAFLLLFIGIYLVFFNVTIPHGDALRISRQIAAGELIWNPNHLLLDPFGYLWTKLLRLADADISVLGGFELISAIATLISALIFHRILLLLDVKSAWLRVLVVIGLFSSKNFLSMALSQYFFMLQMPFLLAAVYSGLHFHKRIQAGLPSNASLYVMGACMAIATGIEVNNVVPVFLIGAALAISASGSRPSVYVRPLRFWGAAAALGFPIFVGGYLLSGSGSGFLSWLLAYQGEAGSSLDAYYGTRMTLSGIMSSGASLLFHLFFGNMVETAGLGTILKVLALQQPLEFTPDTAKIILSGFLMPVAGIALLHLFGWAFRHGRRSFLVRLCLFWLSGYLIFNFFWPYTSDLFWFQLLPLIWLLFVARWGATGEPGVIAGSAGPRPGIKLLGFTSIAVACLLVLNTSQTILPLARADIETNSARHRALLQEGDLEIVPGWDNYKWMMQEGADAATRKLLLMNLALEAKDSPRHISRLADLVRTHLRTGQRVVVGRLYDLDRESNPWYGLADLGWPRKKIQAVLGEFCSRRLGTIDDVGFHELYICDRGTDPGPH